jgi:hypothetical protein
MERDEFVRVLSRFRHIYESGQYHGTLEWINIYSMQGSEKEVQTRTSTSRLTHKFAKEMQNEFEMSLLGELSFFLGL